jgi:hypothetical protein
MLRVLIMNCCPHLLFMMLPKRFAMPTLIRAWRVLYAAMLLSKLAVKGRDHWCKETLAV